MEGRRAQPKPHRPAKSWEVWLESQAEVFLLYARSQTRSEADAYDVLQEALTEAWTKSGRATPDKQLVFATIRRRAIDLGRSIDRRTRREQSVAGDDVAWFVPDYSAGDTREHLASAIGELPANLREALLLRVWGGMSFPEIAELTGTPVATATSRYRYALQRMRESESLIELR